MQLLCTAHGLAQVKAAGELDAEGKQLVEAHLRSQDRGTVHSQHCRAHVNVEVWRQMARPQRLPQLQPLRAILNIRNKKFINIIMDKRSQNNGMKHHIHLVYMRFSANKIGHHGSKEARESNEQVNETQAPPGQGTL